MKKNEKTAIVFGSILFLVPLLIFLLNQVFFSKINTLPAGIRQIDKPFYSYMTFNKNFTGASNYLNLYSGKESFLVKTNKYGFRGNDIDWTKKLILVSGDSTIFGIRINQNKTFAQQLQNHLSGDFFVINGGIPGKAVIHNYYTLESFHKDSIAKNNPLKVFINSIYVNDMVESIDEELFIRRWKKENLSSLEKISLKYERLHFIYTTLKNPTSLGAPFQRFMKSFFTDYKFQEQKISFLQTGEAQSKKLLSKFTPQSKRYLKKIYQFCQENKIKLINLIIPRNEHDIVSSKGTSDLVELEMKNIGMENIIKAKDIYLREKLNEKIINQGSIGHSSEESYLKLAKEISSRI